MVTAPVKLHIVMIYRLLGQLGTFIDELYGLLSSFSVDGSPLVVFGDFEIHQEKPYTADCHIHYWLHLISNGLPPQALKNQATSLA